VTFYSDDQYRGTAVPLGPGEYTLAQLESSGLRNDAMTSLRVPQGWTVEVYQDDYFQGVKWLFTSDTPNVYDAVNDQMSSVRIFAS
jgi:hypothetical protein